MSDDSDAYLSVCPKCDPGNPAARYADTCVLHRAEDSLPAHYIGCDRFEVYNYGTRQGTCDCTATDDMRQLLDLVVEFRKRDESASRVIDRLTERLVR